MLFRNLLYTTVLLLLHTANSKSLTDYKPESGMATIAELTDSITKVGTDSVRLRFGKEIGVTLKQILADSRSFEQHFDTLTYIGKLVSPDKKFRIFMWNVPYTDGTFSYHAIVQFNPGSDGICRLKELMDTGRNTTNNYSEVVLPASRWFGAMYYGIRQNKVGKKTIYTLLGLRYNNLFTTKKVVDILTVDKDFELTFGAPVILYNGRMLNRLVFEYSINVGMMLKYIDPLEMIVFDHLAPPSALYNGNYKFYGPDFTFDGLRFADEKWLHVTNVDFRQPKK